LYLLGASLQDEQLHAVVVADVVVDVRDDAVLVLVADLYHPVLGAGGVVVEDDGDDAHQVAVLQPSVLELPQQVPGGLPDHLATADVAVVLRELVESLEERLRHRDADDGHVLTPAGGTVKD